ncbi:MAG: MFS transporter [Puniceicoccaceae bacterium]
MTESNKKGPFTSSKDVPPDERVPVKEKLAFALGNVGGGIQERADMALFNPIFVLTCGLSPVVMSTAGLVFRAWDAVTDLTMGWLSDNTRSRWGRRKPYIFIGAILMGLAMPSLFFFDRDWSVGMITIWLFGMGLLAYTALTVFNIPYQALYMEMTPNAIERTNVAAWRAYLGKSVDLVMVWMWWFVQLPLFNNALGETDVINGARWATSGLGIMVIALGLLPAFFIRERYYHTVEKMDKVGFWKNFKLTFQNKLFVLISVITLIYGLGLNLKWGLDFYTKVFYVCGGDQQLAAKINGVGGTINIFTSMAGIPLFQYIARIKGKRFSLALSIFIVCAASLSTFLFYTPAYPWLSLAPIMLLTPAATGMWVIIPSMVADIVDYDELKTNERREGAFGAVFSWIIKFSWSIAFGISGPLVVWAGYNVDLHKEMVPDDILFNMRILLAVLPFIVLAPAVFLAARFPMTTEMFEDIKQQLIERRGKIS